jgi:hypothetical protein
MQGRELIDLILGRAARVHESDDGLQANGAKENCEHGNHPQVAVVVDRLDCKG